MTVFHFYAAWPSVLFLVLGLVGLGVALDMVHALATGSRPGTTLRGAVKLRFGPKKDQP